jgi:hypothetical protein
MQRIAIERDVGRTGLVQRFVAGAELHEYVLAILQA